MIGGILLILFVIALLLGLQIWLGSKKSRFAGLVQPAVWTVFALISNLMPRMEGVAVQSGVRGAGAIVMAVLSLAAFGISRHNSRKYKEN